jgi:DNA-directed RNA polymerase beta' subunit
MIRTIYSLVKVLCPFCCRLMLSASERDQLRSKTERLLSGLVAQSTFGIATKQAKNKRLCPHADCFMPQPKFSLD